MVGSIERGLLVLLGLDQGDDRSTADRMVDKLLAYRVFCDDEGRMNRSVTEVGGAVLLVSQFTLSADTRKGLRPSFSSALPPEEAEPLYEYLLSRLQSRHPNVAAGVFGADMQVICHKSPREFKHNRRSTQGAHRTRHDLQRLRDAVR